MIKLPFGAWLNAALPEAQRFLRRWLTAIRAVRRKTRLLNAADRVVITASRIPAGAAALERQYLAMHESLAALGPVARELVDRGKRLVDLASGRDMAQANFERAVGLIEGVLAALAKIQDSLSDLIPGLRQTAISIGSLLKVEQDLAAAIAPLDSIQIMLRIESALLPADRQRAFGGLTEEIFALCLRAKIASAANLESITALRRSLNAALTGVEKQHLERQRTLQRRRSDVADALHRIAGEIQRNAGKKLEITTATKGLQAQLSCVVVTLQTQDIVAQRLDHSREGAAKAVAAARDFAGEWGRDAALRARALLRVEEKQLESASADLAGAARDLGSAVDAIHAHLRAFDSDCLTLREFGEITASVNGTVQVLLDSFESLRRLVKETAQCMNEIKAMLRPCETLARQATDAVEEISTAMRVIALNAQIHAIQIDERTGLEVLAAQACAIAAATAEIGARAGKGAEDIAELLGSGLGHADALLRECQDARERLEAGATAEEEALHALRNAALTEVQAMGQAIECARQASSGLSAAAGAAGALEIVEELRRAALDLDSLIMSVDGSPETDLGGYAEDLKSSYSMLKERMAHGRALGSEAGLAAIEEPEKTQALTPAGVELF